MKTIKRSKLKILLMFLIMGMMSFIPEKNPELFGDFTCKGSKYQKLGDTYITNGCSVIPGAHEPSKHWGFRHWVWFAAGLTFAVWTIVEVIDNAQKN
jgi:hypothetical protein